LKKLISYITSSYPSKSFTIDLISSLRESGTDAIELGIAFSDPVADGPVIEKASNLTIANGFKINDIFEISSAVKDTIDLYWMGYFNSFYQKGFENMITKANESSVKGFIIPDLPLEEAKIYTEVLNNYNFSLVDFIAPTDSKERIELIAKHSKNFIYLVAYAGITGASQSEDLSEIVKSVRAVSKTPIYVGFGVDKDTAKERARGVDGVIVGSAFIKILIDDSLTSSQKIDKMSSLSKEIKERINS
jgi:tryptophan synthase alpha chain